MRNRGSGKKTGSGSKKQHSHSSRPRLSQPQGPGLAFSIDLLSGVALLLTAAASIATFGGCSDLEWTFDDELSVVLNADVVRCNINSFVFAKCGLTKLLQFCRTRQHQCGGY